MKALLLIGGMATRLNPLSKHLAKSLMPICDRELLHYQITQLALAGINHIVLAAGHQVEQLHNFVQGYSGGLEFYFSIEPEPRGTAGAIAQAREYLAGEPVVVLNADILSSVPIKDVVETHQRGARLATVVGYKVQDPARYGLLAVAGAELQGFSEKPQEEPGPGPHYINAGIYVLEPAAYGEIPFGRAVSIERETFPLLLEQHGSLTHFAHEGLWIDIGTFESYFRANFELLGRRYVHGEDWLWGERDDCAVFKDLVFLSKHVQLGRSVDLFHRVIVMREARIGDECRLENCLLLPGATVGAKSALRDTIVGPAAAVADGSRIANQVIIEGEDAAPFYPRATDA